MLYIDTADINEVKKYADLGVIHGVTTNQAILLKNGQSNIKKVICDLCDAIDFVPINIELTKTSGSDADLVAEANEYFKMSNRIVIKIPMWPDGRGLRIAKLLHRDGIPTNLTCCMSVEQVLLAASAGSEYVSLFFNRIADYSTYDAACLTLRRAHKILEDYGVNTLLIAGSIRKPTDVADALINGVDIVTVPPKILEQLFLHPKTSEVILEFDNAWKKLTQKDS